MPPRRPLGRQQSVPSPALLGPWVNGPRWGGLVPRDAHRQPMPACSGGSSKLESDCTHREWCPVSLDVLAWLRPAGRTETLTEAITPATDETENPDHGVSHRNTSCGATLDVFVTVLAIGSLNGRNPLQYRVDSRRCCRGSAAPSDFRAPISRAQAGAGIPGGGGPRRAQRPLAARGAGRLRTVAASRRRAERAGATSIAAREMTASRAAAASGSLVRDSEDQEAPGPFLADGAADSAADFAGRCAGSQ